MRSFSIGFLSINISVELPEVLYYSIEPFLTHIKSEPIEFTKIIKISQSAEKMYQLHCDAEMKISSASSGQILSTILQIFEEECAGISSHLVMKAALVGRHQKSIAIVSKTPSDAKRVAACLINQDFDYLAGNQFALSNLQTEALPQPLFATNDCLEAIGALEPFKFAPSLRTGDGCFIEPLNDWTTSRKQHTLSTIFIVNYQTSATLKITSLTNAQTNSHLLPQIVNNDIYVGTDVLDQIAGDIPTYLIEFGHLDGLHLTAGLLSKMILDNDLDRSGAQQFLGAFNIAPTAKELKKYPIPKIADRKLTPKLTIGMATYDDFDGVYFSLHAMRLYHPEILDDVEFIVVDNNPEGVCSSFLKTMEDKVPNLRYIPFVNTTGTAVRDHIFQQASGKYVLCMDCHVMFPAGALKRLIDYFDDHPYTKDLLQGPLLHDELNCISSHWVPTWNKGMWGTWENNPEANNIDAEPFDIPMMGLGIFACTKAAWPGFNPAFNGFGGEEGYLHEKFRQRGGRTLCLPFLRWVHRFARPMGVPYRINWEDRMRNYLYGFNELGLPLDEFKTHFSDYLNPQFVDAAFERYYKEVNAIEKHAPNEIAAEERQQQNIKMRVGA